MRSRTNIWKTTKVPRVCFKSFSDYLCRVSVCLTPMNFSKVGWYLPILSSQNYFALYWSIREKLFLFIASQISPIIFSIIYSVFPACGIRNMIYSFVEISIFWGLWRQSCDNLDCLTAAEKLAEAFKNSEYYWITKHFFPLLFLDDITEVSSTHFQTSQLGRVSDSGLPFQFYALTSRTSVVVSTSLITSLLNLL